MDDVFHKVADRYDVMNDLMSFGLHRRVEGHPDRQGQALRVSTLRPSGRGRRHRRRRVPDRPRAAAADTHVTVADINADMLRVGAQREVSAGSTARIAVRRGDAVELPFGDAEFDGYTIAFGIRNVPRIEAALAGGVSRAEARRALSSASSSRRSICRRSTVCTTPTPLRRSRRSAGGGGRRRALPVSRRIDSQFSRPPICSPT